MGVETTNQQGPNMMRRLDRFIFTKFEFQVSLLLYIEGKSKYFNPCYY